MSNKVFHETVNYRDELFRLKTRPLVHCGECIHYITEIDCLKDETRMVCACPDGKLFYPRPEDYCSRGELDECKFNQRF